MATLLPLTCPVCKCEFTVDLDEQTPWRTIDKGQRVVYRGGKTQPSVIEYRFLCPLGDYFIQAVEIDDPKRGAP